MTPPDPRGDLPPEQDAVRRLLAQARHDEPVPPEVAARLDAVLGELSAERRGGSTAVDPAREPAGEGRDREAAPVVDLGARRRRAIGVALVAAAAVVVAGVGIGQVVQVGGEDASSASDAGGGADSEMSEKSRGGLEAPEEDVLANDGLAAMLVPEVSSSALRRDLGAALVSARRRQSYATGPETGDAETGAEGTRTACPAADTSRVGQGRQVPVTFDGQPALAVYRAPEDSRREVDVYLCGADVPSASVVLPAP